MDNHKLSNTYLLSSIFSLFIMPITGIIALSYAISAKRALMSNKEQDGIEQLLKRCYKWLKITGIVALIMFPLLVIFFILLPLLMR